MSRVFTLAVLMVLCIAAYAQQEIAVRPLPDVSAAEIQESYQKKLQARRVQRRAMQTGTAPVAITRSNQTLSVQQAQLKKRETTTAYRTMKQRPAEKRQVQPSFRKSAQVIE